MPRKTEREIGIRLSIKDNELVERALKSVGKDGEAALKRIQASAIPATTQLKALNGAAGLARAGMAGLIAGLTAGGITGLVRTVTGVAESIAETGAEAERAGVSFRVFQELSYVAERNKVSVDALTDGMKELQLRADEFIVTGSGSAAESFKRLGYSAEDLNKKLKDPSALFSEIIGKLGQLDKAAQIRVADELFGGTGGEQFVRLIAQGEQGIADTIDRAHELGKVMSDETLQKAKDLDQAFSDVATTVSTQLQQAVVNATWALFDFLQQFWDVEQRTTASLENRLSEIAAQRAELEAKIVAGEEDMRSFTGAGPSAAMINFDLAQAREQLNTILKEKEEIDRVLAARIPPKPPETSDVPTIPGLDDATKKLEAEAKRLTDSLRTASEAYAAEIERLDGLLAKQLISQEAYNRAVSAAVLERHKAAIAEGDFAQALALVDAAKAKGILSEAKYTAAVEEGALKRLEAENTWQAGVALGLDRIRQQGEEINKTFSDAAVRGVEAFEDKLVEAFTTGKADWSDLARTILTDLIRINTRQNITGPISGFLSNLFNPFAPTGGAPINLLGSAKGNAFSGAPGLSAYSGSVVSRPTVFPFARGVGLMGEAGPEAILPLRRGNDGRLGVSGGGMLVQIIDQRAGGAEIVAERTQDANGREIVRAVVRDEMRTFWRDSSRERADETVGVVRQARTQGRL